MCTVNINRLHTDTGVLKGSGSVGGQREEKEGGGKEEGREEQIGGEGSRREGRRWEQWR